MRCEDFQDWIFLEDVDGCLSVEQAQRLEQHLAECLACEALVEDVRKHVVTPVQQLREKTVPDELWPLLKQRLEDEACSLEVPAAKPRWRPSFEFLRSGAVTGAMAMAMIAVVILAVRLGPRDSLRPNSVAVQSVGESQISYLVSLFEEETGEDLEGEQRYGTRIEEYFL